MAQRSARARVKLDKISGGAPTPPALHPHSHSWTPNKGVSKAGAGGLITPSTSSGSGSSRGSFQQHSGPKIGKSTLRSFFDSHSERLRGRLLHGSSLNKKDGHGGGYGAAAAGQGLGLGGGLFGEDKTVVKRWEGGGRRGEVWDGFGRGRKVCVDIIHIFIYLSIHLLGILLIFFLVSRTWSSGSLTATPWCI